MPKIKLCFAQITPKWEYFEENLKKADSYAHSAADLGADIIIFPEQSATGWDPDSVGNASDDHGYIPDVLKKIAKKNKIAVLGSFREKAGDLFRNTSVFFDDSGNQIAKYSKIHLFTPGGENKFYSGGKEPRIFSYKGMKFGLAICYDLRFADLFSYYASAGCECVIIQAAWPCVRMKHWNILAHSRAVENQYYIAGVNTTGETPVSKYCGGSLVVSPTGDTILQANETEGLFFAEIDSFKVIEAKTILPSLSDRRDDLYIEWRRE